MMATYNTWFPLYVGDYLRDTMHLSTTRHGAYMLLIMAYWVNGGPLPDDDGHLAATARLSLSEWAEMRTCIGGFFIIGMGVWRHKRIDIEIVKSKQIAQVRSDAGLKGNLQRWGRYKKIRETVANVSQMGSQTDRKGIANGSQTGVPSPSPSPSQAPEQPPPPRTVEKFVQPGMEEIFEYAKELQLPPTQCEQFHDHYAANGWKVGKNPMKDWKAAMRNWRKNWKRGTFGNTANGSSNGSPKKWTAAEQDAFSGV